MILIIDARCLAVASTQSASVALFGINHRCQPREARDCSQHGAHRTDSVAIGTSAAPCQYDEHHQGNYRNDKGGQACHPHLCFIESIAIHALGKVGQEVVSPSVDRRQQVACNAAKRAIGCQQRHQRAYTAHQGSDEQNKHSVAQPILGCTIAIAILLLLFAHPSEDVLQHAQRTNHRTIHTSKQQRQRHQKDNHSNIQCQHSRQELNLCHPSKPRMNSPRKVEEEQRD